MSSIRIKSLVNLRYMITFVILGKLLKAVQKISPMMLETCSALNSKILFLFKDLLENIRKKKVYTFRFLQAPKAKDR